MSAPSRSHSVLDVLPMNTATIAREVVRSLRGPRSQLALSRRLGYRTNVLYLWESGRGGPTAVRFLRLAQAVGLDVTGALLRFYGNRPPWLEKQEPASALGVAALLRDLKGPTSILDCARAAGCSRFALARWLKGEAEPQLADFLRLVQVTSQRVLDFVACFTDPAAVPSLRVPWRRLQNARRAAYAMPWSHAVLRTLELESYRKLPAHVDGWFGSQLGISREEEMQCLRLLEETGQVRFRRGKWFIGKAITTDTRQDPDAARKLKAWWFRVAADRFEAGATGVFSYNLFGVSARDFERLVELQRSYFRQLRSIVAQSQPVERVALVNLQLLTLEPPTRQDS
jgi:transcriptional regulator with XRE-family HTH domain